MLISGTPVAVAVSEVNPKLGVAWTAPWGLKLLAARQSSRAPSKVITRRIATEVLMLVSVVTMTISVSQRTLHPTPKARNRHEGAPVSMPHRAA